MTRERRHQHRDQAAAQRPSWSRRRRPAYAGARSCPTTPRLYLRWDESNDVLRQHRHSQRQPTTVHANGVGYRREPGGRRRRPEHGVDVQRHRRHVPLRPDARARPARPRYSLETWFKTTSTVGGKIIGFGNKTALELVELRQAHLHDQRRQARVRRLERPDPHGHHARGRTTTASGTTSSPRQGRSAGMVLYVDGVQVRATNTTTGNAEPRRATGASAATTCTAGRTAPTSMYFAGHARRDRRLPDRAVRHDRLRPLHAGQGRARHDGADPARRAGHVGERHHGEPHVDAVHGQRRRDGVRRLPVGDERVHPVRHPAGDRHQPRLRRHHGAHRSDELLPHRRAGRGGQPQRRLGRGLGVRAGTRRHGADRARGPRGDDQRLHGRPRVDRVDRRLRHGLLPRLPRLGPRLRPRSGDADRHADRERLLRHHGAGGDVVLRRHRRRPGAQPLGAVQRGPGDRLAAAGHHPAVGARRPHGHAQRHSPWPCRGPRPPTTPR